VHPARRFHEWFAVPEARPATGLVVHPLRDGLIAAAAVILALVALDVVFLNQGALLSPALGKVAAPTNYVHESAHDGRHLLGAPATERALVTSLLSRLGRGALAGGAAGLVSGGFSWLLAEPVSDRAVRLEAATRGGERHGTGRG
jgi:hypothetical protein